MRVCKLNLTGSVTAHKRVLQRDLKCRQQPRYSGLYSQLSSVLVNRVNCIYIL